MATDITGTIITIKEYLSTNKKIISIGSDPNHQDSIVLAENRIYEIPHYQRELRWSIDTIQQLISDLKSVPKFLGNIIMSIDSGKYEIIDGQQRTTILLMIISCL